MILGLKKKQKPPENSLRNFHSKRNKVLIIRNARGIGDILSARMLFKNFKDLNPKIHLTFACFEDYIQLVQGHPHIDEVVSIDRINKTDYMASYDISDCCIKYESREMSKNVKHRAEIWADHCGISIKDTNMFLPFIDKEKMLDGNLAVKQLRDTSQIKYNKTGPSVLFSPLAYEKLRSLSNELMADTVNFLRSKGLFVYSTHTAPVEVLQQLEVPILTGKSLADWMSYIHAADYVVTVDTSNFHYAGAIGKPLTGIFTHVDGKLRGKFYDFVLVQKHRDNGDWPCGGPCYNYLYCSHPKCDAQVVGPNNLRTPLGLRPCVTELTADEIRVGVEKMLEKWPI